jgi:hAT family C-terminal dimerisation region
MYSGLKDDYKDDTSLLSYLEDAKELLTTHFHQFYAHKDQSSKQYISDKGVRSRSTNSGGKNKEPKFDFTARYSKKERQTFDELEEYLKLHPEDFGSCCPFQWWQGRRAQFPNLYRLATDVLSIPGNISNSFVIVDKLLLDV